jgi:hypothetical protein
MRYTGRYILPLHASAKVLQQRLPGVDFNDYYRFAVVRNPWDRVVSMYMFHQSPRKRITDPKRFRENAASSFNDYVEALCSDGPKNQTDFLFCRNDGALDMDYIAKVENLAADMTNILDALGLPHAEISRTNTTKHSHYTQYYDNYTRALIARAFSRDIELLKYEFGA